MLETKEGYKFECSGREFSTHGTEGISVTKSGTVRCGYDSIVDFWNDQTEEYENEFSDEEKKELAVFMIAHWSKFGGLS